MVVSVAGELDISTGPALRELLAAAISDGPRTILLDLSEVKFVDCYSIGLIIAASNAARDLGRLLRVDGVDRMTKDLFNVLGLQSLLTAPAGDGMGGHDGGE